MSASERATEPRPPIRIGTLNFSVEHRAAGGAGGPTLRICDDSGAELLRFDCFRTDPHYHLATARGGISFGATADPIQFAIDAIRTDLADYLKRAGHEHVNTCPTEQLALLLGDVESRMRNPPAQLDLLDLEQLKTRLSEKWNTYPNEILPAWVAEMDFPLAEPIRVLLQRSVDRWDLGYPVNPSETGLRECFSERMEQRFDWRIDPGQVEILTDVVQGLYAGLIAYSEPGDGAVIQTPMYPPFFDSVRETGRRIVEHRLAPPRSGEPGYPLDLEPLRQAADERTRVLLLCNPSNPTGRVYRRSELMALAELARERDWIVLVDEIHQDLVFSGHEHIPFATLSDDAASRTVTITSATKAFNIPGLRCAVAHFGTPELQKRFNAATPRHIRGGIGLLGIYATMTAWQHADPWLDEVREYLEANRDFALDFLCREIPGIRCQPQESTYLTWLDFRELDLSPGPAAFFYRRAKVALSDGRKFGEGWEGFARLNIATSRALLEQILERLALAVRER